MEVVDFLFAFAVFVGPIAYLRQGFVAVGIGVDIGIAVFVSVGGLDAEK